MRNYDPKAILMNVGGSPMMGLANGTFVKIERNEDTFALHVGADGLAARTRNRNASGRITFTLLQESPSNDILMALAAADELSGTGVVPTMLKDVLGTTLYLAPNSWVVKPADGEFAKEAGTREWIVETDFLVPFTGGALP